MSERGSWCYDIETIKSCFTYTAINIDTEEIVKYVIHKDRNDLPALIDHLSRCRGHIGFNNINFDYPVIHYILTNYRSWYMYTNDQIIKAIYAKAQELISNQNVENYFPAIREKEVLISQLDLFRLWHYNNKARMTSLKSLEISMNYPNVMDMPLDHTNDNIKLEDIESILEYNLNDVLATYEFYKRSQEKIALRKDIQKKYGLKCINYSDSAIGEKLLLDLYCKKTEQDPWEVRKMRSKRSSINLGEIIFDYVQFDNTEFNNLLEKLKSTTVTQIKGALSESVIYKGFQYDYGLGGIHGCIRPGVYESNDEFIIIDCDVASLYPNVAIKNRLYPEHLGEDFVDIYDEEIIQERLRAKAAGIMSVSDALKLSANTVYGKSNEETSFLYDPKYTLATTVNGQLLLTMLAEKFVDGIRDITMIQVNTDGITVKIPRSEQDKYYSICKQWMELTRLELEYVEYAKMAIRDVNNYMAISAKGKLKYKGAFEIDKVVGNERAYHKDNSFRIVPIALSEYFVNGKNPEDVLHNHTNIYDFCGRQKFGFHSYGELVYAKGTEIVHEKQQKNVRYYISRKGKTFIKQYTKGETEQIHKGYRVQVFNKYEEKTMAEYAIDYRFYLREIYKVINVVDSQQTKFK